VLNVNFSPVTGSVVLLFGGVEASDITSESRVLPGGNRLHASQVHSH